MRGNAMGYCFYLYTPDLIERDSGKFAACEKYFFQMISDFRHFQQ